MQSVNDHVILLVVLVELQISGQTLFISAVPESGQSGLLMLIRAQRAGLWRACSSIVRKKRGHKKQFSELIVNTSKNTIRDQIQENKCNEGLEVSKRGQGCRVWMWNDVNLNAELIIHATVLPRIKE